jgi:hypothetical protein
MHTQARAWRPAFNKLYKSNCYVYYRNLKA